MTTPAQASKARSTPVRMTASKWLALLFVAVFGYFDWIMHRSIATTLVLALIAAALIVFWQQIIAALNLGETVAAIPARAKPILAAVPAIVYFLARGQGTSGSGGIVLVSMIVVVVASALFGPTLDRKLVPYYAVRNRVLPKPIRVVLAVVLPVLVAFLVIHGSLADLPAMFGGKTHHPATPVNREGRFFLGAILSAALAWLLMRDAAPVAAPAGVPATAAAAVPTVVPTAAPAVTPAVTPAVPVTAAAQWTPSHAVPPGGLTAWAEPSPTAATTNLDAGLPVQVLTGYGDWVQIAANNGWTGWVDGRLLQPLGGQQ